MTTLPQIPTTAARAIPVRHEAGAQPRLRLRLLLVQWWRAAARAFRARQVAQRVNALTVEGRVNFGPKRSVVLIGCQGRHFLIAASDEALAPILEVRPEAAPGDISRESGFDEIRSEPVSRRMQSASAPRNRPRAFAETLETEEQRPDAARGAAAARRAVRPRAARAARVEEAVR